MADLSGEKALDIDDLKRTKHNLATLATHYGPDGKDAISSSHTELVLATRLTGDAHLISVGEVVDRIVAVFSPSGESRAERDSPGSVLHGLTLSNPHALGAIRHDRGRFGSRRVRTLPRTLPALIEARRLPACRPPPERSTIEDPPRTGCVWIAARLVELPRSLDEALASVLIG